MNIQFPVKVCIHECSEKSDKSIIIDIKEVHNQDELDNYLHNNPVYMGTDVDGDGMIVFNCGYKVDGIKYTKYYVLILVEPEEMGYLDAREKEIEVFVPSSHSDPERYIHNHVARNYGFADVLEWYEY